MAEAQKDQVYTKMKYKLFIPLILVFLISLTLVSANTAITYNLKDVNGNLLDNVDYLIFNCNDNKCSQVSIPNFVDGNNKGNSNTNGNNYDIKIVYPENLETQYGYAQYFFKDGYLPMEGFADWHGNYIANKDVIFIKKDSCEAEIKSVNVLKTRDDIIESPINIQVDIGSNVASPFRENSGTPVYVPINEGYTDFYSGDVQVKTEIYKVENVTGKDQLVYSEIKDGSIFMDSSATVDFTWIPNREGNYMVNVETDVIDNKCNSNTKLKDTQSKNFDVFVSRFPSVEILTPEENEIISGEYQITWLATDEDQDDNTLDIVIQYRKDGFVSLLSDFLTMLSSDFDNWKIIEDNNNQDNNDGMLSWNTKYLENGPYQLRIIAKDDDNNQDVSDITDFWIVNIEQGNNDPFFLTETLPIAYVNKLYNPFIEAYDPDFDALNFYLLQGPSGMTIDSQTGRLHWIPSSNYLGDNEITVRLDDGNGGIADKSFNVLVRESGFESGEVASVHKFTISHAFAKQNNKFIDVYVQLTNKGNKKEDVELQATLVETRSKAIDKTSLALGETDWKILRLRNPGTGKYLILITARSDDFDNIKYLEINVK